MSRFDYDGSQLVKLEAEMNALGVAMDGPIAVKMLEAGAEQVKDDWVLQGGKHGYRAPGSTGRGTGTLLDSIGYPEGVKTIPGGHAVDIYPQGERVRGRNKKTRNAEIAFVLNAMSGWVDEADDLDNAKVYPRMTEVMNEEVAKIRKG